MNRPRLVAVLVILASMLASCGGPDDPLGAARETTATATATAEATRGVDGEANRAPDHGADATRAPQGPVLTTDGQQATPNATPGAGRVLTPEELRQYRPNELGQVPILMYHVIGEPAARFTRTPDQLRGDLQWLYDHGFYVVRLRDVLDNTINIPAGRKPVVLTFDDSSASQFRLVRLADGTLNIDSNSAVGILEDFFAKHPDFGRGAVFAIQSNFIFDWAPNADESGQTQYAQTKLQWLYDNGYEFSNHTINHANLSKLDNAEIMRQLATVNDTIERLVPGARVDTITLPYGMYPSGGNDTLLRGFTYNGKSYTWDAVLMVGASPAVVPLSNAYDPYAIARIQAFDEELNKWFKVFVDNPGILYVSDGNPNTVTVPKDLHPWLAGTLDETQLNGRKLIRY